MPRTGEEYLVCEYRVELAEAVDLFGWECGYV